MVPYSHYRRELMGHAVLRPMGRFEAGSWQSFTLVYTAGRFGVDDTGSLKIGFRFATDFGPVQFDDPKGAGYTTVEASNGARLDCRWEFKRNIRPWSRSLYIGVMQHFLQPGDTITIRFGDQRQGSPGIRMQTYCERDFEFHVLTDVIATYDYVPIENSPTISIVPGPGEDWIGVLPSMKRAGEPFSLAIKVNDKWGNPSDQMEQMLTLSASHPIEGLPKVARLQMGSFATILTGLHCDEPLGALQGGPRDECLTISISDEAGALLCRTNPLRIVGRDAEFVHFWGDTHGQSNETLGTNTARDYFAFGRDKAFLDVMGHQGNDFQISGAFWRALNELTAEFDEPGKFVCIPGYEWSANTAVGGDRNVHYRFEGETIHRSSHAQIANAADMRDEENDAHTAPELFKKLEGKDCVVMAHVGGRYADITFAHDGALETAVEVHSAWGTFEWILWDAFKKGYRVGVVANSDGHKGRPGADYPGASFFGARGGLTCHLAPQLDRDAIFECMRRRHHYATTGARMMLDVRVETPGDAILYRRDPALGQTTSRKTRRLIMGDIARVTDDVVTLVVSLCGSAPIERLDVFVGPNLVQTIRPYGSDDLGARFRLVYEGAQYRGRARTSIWDGALELSGNAMTRAEMFNNWNLDRGIQKQTRQGVSWKAVTTGNFGGLDLWLEDARGGQIAFRTDHVSGTIAVDDIGLEDSVFDAGGLARRVRLFRLPAELHETTMAHRVGLPVAPRGDTPVFVRVTQIDGHQAWSSPIYLFK